VALGGCKGCSGIPDRKILIFFRTVRIIISYFAGNSQHSSAVGTTAYSERYYEPSVLGAIAFACTLAIAILATISCIVFRRHTKCSSKRLMSSC